MLVSLVWVSPLIHSSSGFLSSMFGTSKFLFSSVLALPKIILNQFIKLERSTKQTIKWTLRSPMDSLAYIYIYLHIYIYIIAGQGSTCINNGVLTLPLAEILSCPVQCPPSPLALYRNIGSMAHAHHVLASWHPGISNSTWISNWLDVPEAAICSTEMTCSKPLRYCIIYDHILKSSII